MAPGQVVPGAVLAELSNPGGMWGSESSVRTLGFEETLKV